VQTFAQSVGAVRADLAATSHGIEDALVPRHRQDEIRRPVIEGEAKAMRVGGRALGLVVQAVFVEVAPIVLRDAMAGRIIRSA
jgi:hypothetical protein